MKEFSYCIQKETGLHVRPAAVIAHTAEKYDSKVGISNGQISINGKSMMSMFALKAAQGETITVTVKGPDEEKAAAAILEACREVL